jgi:xylulokinase
MSYMGLDIGQTGCKAVVFDDNGRQAASAYREYKTLVPAGGQAELDTALVRDSCFFVVREANGKCTSDPVRGIGITSQGEAFTPVDGSGNYLANAMITFDTRATEIAGTWSERFGKKRLYEMTGHTAHPMFSLFKLLWLKEHRRDVFDHTWKFLCFEDLMQHAFGLEPCISWPLAGRTMLFNPFLHRWETKILDEAGVTESQFARPVAPGTVCGMIEKKRGQALGFQQEVTVAAAGHDQPAGALGAGAVSPGSAMYAIGTSECISPSFATPVTSDELFRNNLPTYDHAMKGRYTTTAFSLTGGNILRWFRDQWGALETECAAREGKDPYELLLAQIGDTPSGLLCLPYFTPTGTPYYDAEVSGAILGLRLTTKRSEVLRALLEGVSFEMRLNLSILENAGVAISELRAIGGGAKSGRWLQLKSDVIGTPITTVEITEAASLGGAMLACSAVTGEPVDSLVSRWVKTGPTVYPDQKRAGFYTELFSRYKKLYPALRSLKF